MKFAVLIKIIVMSLFVMAFPSKAGLIGSSTGVNITQRTCPDVNAAYIEQWRDAIESDGLKNRLPGGATYENACIFKTNFQQYFDESGEINGSKISDQIALVNVDEAYLENEDKDIWLQAKLDNTALSLPEAHFLVSSDAFERNSANLFSAQSYVWSGADETLEFTADFDFSLSLGMWGDSFDSAYFLVFGASTGMILEPGNVFPADWGEDLARGSYSSREDDALVADVKAERTLTISFDVTDGDEFTLWGLSQAFGLNGGYVDSQNTLRTQLAVQGQTAQQSAATLAQSVSVIKVPEPTTIMLFAAGLLLIGVRRVF